MELRDSLAFATAHPVCYLATEEGDQPRVRALLMWFADERGFYFMTMTRKSLSRQLHTNPKVEICFFNGACGLPDAQMMRVSGEVEFVDDDGLTRRVAEERAELQGVINQQLDPLTEIFRLRTDRAWFWGLGDIVKESDARRVTS
jgi:pyridoxamine 5'-phosphate oxidase